MHVKESNQNITLLSEAMVVPEALLFFPLSVFLSFKMIDYHRELIAPCITSCVRG